MKYCALGTMLMTLAFGVPAASGLAVGLVGLTTSAAQADIFCGRFGCQETGRTLRRNGSYYRGLGRPAGYNEINGIKPKTDNKQTQPAR
jgi:hypothetical protein